MSENEIFEKLDLLANGKLSAEEQHKLNDALQHDPALDKKAKEHMAFVRSLKSFGRRQAIKSRLDLIHAESITPVDTKPLVAQKVVPLSAFKKYWPMAAVAASVALFSVIGTLLMTQSLDTKQTAYYKELRRNVEQIKQSQNIILKDIAVSKEKAAPTPAPGKYAGTGFLVSGNGYVVTSFHVVKGADSVYIVNEKFGRLKATVVFSDAANDLSVLRIESNDFKPLRSLPYTISTAEASLGEDVFTLGFPREDVIFGEGSISAASGYKQNPNAYQVSVPVNPGNSGGPLFNSRGDLVGIISGLQTETYGAAFAIKSTILHEVIKQIQIDTTLAHPAITLPRQNTMRHLSKVDQIKKWKDCVFVVSVYNNK